MGSDIRIEGETAGVALPGMKLIDGKFVFLDFVLLDQTLEPLVQGLFVLRPFRCRLVDNPQQDREHHPANPITQVGAAIVVDVVGIARREIVQAEIGVHRVSFQLTQIGEVA